MRRRKKHPDGDHDHDLTDTNPTSDFSEQLSSSISLSPLQPHQYIPPSSILPFLYLGSGHSLHEESLTQLGITHVLSLCKTPHYHTDCKIHKHVLLRDASSQALRPHVEDVCAFIDAAQDSGGACLVHCSAGASRSPAMVLAYFVLRRRCALRDAYAQIKAQRPQVAPNAGFWEQLIEIEKEVLGCNSLTLDDVETKAD